MGDIIRVLRLVEYVGPRSYVEEQVRQSLQGSRTIKSTGVTITSTTLSGFPEVIKPERKENTK